MEEKFFQMMNHKNADTNSIKRTLQNIIKEYQTIINNKPNTDYSERAKLRIATIEYSIMNNSNNAIQILNDILKTKLNQNYVIEATIQLSDIYLTLGTFDSAKKLILNVFSQNTKQPKSANSLNTLKFKLAEIYYFQGEIDSALKYYSELLQSLDNDKANVAINRINFIQRNKDNEKDISNFSGAEFLLQQRKFPEAKAKFNEVIKNSANEIIGELALIQIAKIEIETNNTVSAKSLLITYLDDNFSPMYGDDALFLLGTIAEKENDKESAVDFYGDILLKYPRSVLISEARQRIRILRNQKL